MKIDIDFILAVGKTLSMLIVLVFIEGVISARPNGKWPGLAFAVLIAAVSVAVGLFSHSFAYFLFMLVPTTLCFLAYFVTRRNVAKGLAHNPEEEEP